MAAWFILHRLPLILAQHLAYKPPVKPAEPVLPPVSVSSPVVVTQYLQMAPAAVFKTNVTAAPPTVVETNQEEKLFCVGYSGVNGGYQVLLSDGDIVSTDSGRVSKITSCYVVVDGRRLAIHGIPQPEAAKSERMPAGLSPVPVSASSDASGRVYIPVPVTVGE